MKNSFIPLPRLRTPGITPPLRLELTTNSESLAISGADAEMALGRVGASLKTNQGGDRARVGASLKSSHEAGRARVGASLKSIHDAGRVRVGASLRRS
jgi:hypothetical protein